ncbi:Septum site-determining protein MinD [hydrothermal vent metagenome]|uniref:Septum site-determining protein MinD n=1 Tax=hydrothermal vent metagenome TaxID=652676 RepID=A0A3B0U3M4_9ZZZZ
METLEDRVLSCLRSVTIGVDGQDIVSAGHVHSVAATGNTVRVLIDPDIVPMDARDDLANLIAPIVQDVGGVERVVVKPRPQSPAGIKPLPGVRHIVLIHSGKGGVGKSTLAVNLALALAQDGLKIGLLDADVYGPSAPLLLGLKARIDPNRCETKITPLEAHGIKVMSLGFLMPREQALIWRGSLVDEGVVQLFNDVDWGELDILIVDMPPGTSDVHLALAHRFVISGVLTVTTPGQTSVEDVRRGMEMFADLAVPALGIVENMAGISCKSCGHQHLLFGAHGGSELEKITGVPLLARLPFQPDIAAHAEKGEPVVMAEPDSPSAVMMHEVARALSGILINPSKRYGMSS